jgi:flagellar motor switch protein FliG
VGGGGGSLVLKGRERAAAVLSLLGDELSQKILSYLPENDAVSIISASEQLKTPTKQVLLDVVSEFNDYMVNAKKAPVEEVKEEVINEVQPVPPVQQGTPIEIISRASAQSLAKALDTERPEISAYVLSHLPAEKIYEILHLIKENKELVEARILSMKDVPIAKEIEEKVLKSISERLT